MSTRLRSLVEHGWLYLYLYHDTPSLVWIAPVFSSNLHRHTISIITIHSTWPNHLNLPLLITKLTGPTPNNSCVSFFNSYNPNHTHSSKHTRFSSYSTLCSFFLDHVSLSCIKQLCTQLVYILPFNFISWRTLKAHQSINQFNSNIAAREPDSKWYAVEMIDKNSIRNKQCAYIYVHRYWERCVEWVRSHHVGW